jgi:hypothetical protein
VNLEDYWQENKRFVQTVAAGMVVFFVALWFIGGRYQPGIDEALRERSSLNSKLRAPAYSRSDLDTAEAEGAALDAALERLRAAVVFEPRPGFRLEPDGGTASSQYLRAVQLVKDELVPFCNRANMVLDGSLGLPELSPTREDDIERYAVDSGVARLDEIRVTLDPALRGRGEPPAVEMTRVALTFLGPSGPELALLERLQRDEGLGPMLVGDLLMRSTTDQVDEARLELTLVVARLADRLGDEGAGGGGARRG